MTEQWKPIRGTDARYEVSDTGLVRNARSKRCLQARRPSDGKGLIVSLSMNGHPMPCQVARLVLQHFGPEHERGQVAFHINGNHNDNRISNLRWAEPGESKVGMKYGNHDGDYAHCALCGDYAALFFDKRRKACCAECYDELEFGIIRNQNIHIVGNSKPTGQWHEEAQFDNAIKILEAQQ